MIHVVIYHTKNCMKCMLTAKEFERNSIPVKKILVDPESDWGTQKLEKFKLEGARSFPVVRVYEGENDDGSNPLDIWSDYQLDKIREWVK
ncbi:hypothetical protein [Lactobacillus terrae]|uniref:hypothetical protein n=1 Tax=Lactobacillus terrae TaxID=2269374 RepID=UPI000C1B786F|nr:hypothetical protein [Lactobacillus terrae]